MSQFEFQKRRCPLCRCKGPGSKECRSVEVGGSANRGFVGGGGGFPQISIIEKVYPPPSPQKKRKKSVKQPMALSYMSIIPRAYVPPIQIYQQ